MDLNLGLCNVLLPLTLRISVKVIAANINSACDILQLRCSKCHSSRKTSFAGLRETSLC